MALKTLGELNQDFSIGREMRAHMTHSERLTRYEPITPKVIDLQPPGGSERIESQMQRKGRNVFAFISNIVFYLAIVMIMITVLSSGSENGSPKTLFGYSYFTVISKSMQDEIPMGSFILVKHIDAGNLEIGDTITYIRDRNTSVTHKIVGIYENYNKSGARGFQTKGVNNVNPDSDVVYEANVVGKVIFSVPYLGAAMSWLAVNVYLVFIIFGLCVIISFCIRGLLMKQEKRNAREDG